MDIVILAQQFYEYSSFMRGYSKKTIKRHQYVLNLYIKFNKIKTIDEVTEVNVKALLYHGRMERNWSVNTYLVFYKSLKVFFRWCVNEKFLEVNPTDSVDVPRLENRLPPKLSKQDTLKLIDLIHNYPYKYRFLGFRNHAIFATFVFAGLRKNELLNLKLSDVDIENLTILVRRGKGNKDRVVPISYSLSSILKMYLDERKRLNRTCPEFFVSLHRNMGFTENGLHLIVRDFRKISGIYFTIHKLRHTFATLMLEGGCDIYSLSKMMGHSDIKTTTIYLAASTEHLRKQMVKHPLSGLI
jgi:site-specific recombinase XerD